MAGKRSIFEEVAVQSAPTAPTGGLIARDTGPAPRLIRGWLILLFALVVTMTAVGG